MAKKLIIAAPSARGYAQAAKACGYQAITLDAFADEDTQRASLQTFKLNMNAQGVDAADFKRVFSSINLDEVAGFLYGSLFDNCPDLLAWVAHKIRLVGNTPEVLKQCKDFSFFKLLDDLEILHPEVLFDEQNHKSSFPRKRESTLTLKTNTKKMDSRLRTTRALRFSKCSSTCKVVCGNDGEVKDWLTKTIGGSGGLHIRAANLADLHFAKWGDYFQRKIDGRSISMLFVADGNTAHLIGFNEQLVASTAEFPYRFAGAVGGIALPLNTHAAFEHIAQQLTSALSLRGINSLDAILDGETLWVLELNPRLSATFHLYENLFSLHIQACAGDLAGFSMPKNTSKAQLILYADDALEISADFAWPSWLADIPAVDAAKLSVKIEKNAPICTVLAEAQTAELAHELVLQGAEKLREMLLK